MAETLDTRQAEFTLTELEIVLKVVKNNWFDNDFIHPKTLRNWEPNTTLAVFDLFNMCWIKSIWPWGTSWSFSSRKLVRALMRLQKVVDPYQYQIKLSRFSKEWWSKDCEPSLRKRVSSKKNKKGFKGERTLLCPSTDSISVANGQNRMKNLQLF